MAAQDLKNSNNVGIRLERNARTAKIADDLLAGYD
jgi:hypothetical protein